MDALVSGRAAAAVAIGAVLARVGVGGSGGMLKRRGDEGTAVGKGRGTSCSKSPSMPGAVITSAPVGNRCRAPPVTSGIPMGTSDVLLLLLLLLEVSRSLGSRHGNDSVVRVPITSS